MYKFALQKTNMSVHREDKKITTHVLHEMKSRGEKISMLTAYDYSTATIIDDAGIDVILVGDSASNVMAGHETTLPITLDQMIYHASSVVRGVNRALVVVDLPFGSYQGNSKEALNSTIRIMKESGAHAIKMEGGEEIIESITQRSTRELVSPISRDHWSSMITKFFGAIDGNPNVRDVRQQLFSNENILLVDRTAAGISDRDLSGEIEKLMFEYVRPEIIVEIPQVEPEIIEIPVVENGSTDGEVAVEENVIPEEPVKIEISVDAEPELIQEVEDVQPKRNSLVELISDRFARERDKARARSEAMVQKIRDLFDDMKAKEALGVSSAVAVAAWCALCSIVFVLATSTFEINLCLFFNHRSLV
jgi:hypothetical protein